MNCRWILANPPAEICADLRADKTCSELMARCLVNRGHLTRESAARFLQPRLKELADPFLLPNMDSAVDRLLLARERQEPIVIFGDYDVDGVTATALLLETLQPLGWKLDYYLPRRLEDGYGLSQEAVENCFSKIPAKLLLAVDCGSTSVDTITWLAGKGIDTIVLDHHQLSEPPPPAVALVNPQISQQFTELCSAGLAFKLVHALLKKMRANGFSPEEGPDLKSTLDLVALGTIADLAPLRGENRVLVSAGLARMQEAPRPGLQAIKSVAGITGEIGSYEVGFQIGPRLNAAGRMENADDALHLLLAPSLTAAMPLAEKLDERNRTRQQVERGICDEVIRTVHESFDAKRDLVIIAGRPEWHLGVVGIVASRVMQEFYRPALILGGDGESWRGSGRSIAGFDLAAALRQCADLLTRHGGHAMAAGVSLKPENVDALRARLNDLAQRDLNADTLARPLHIDAEVGLAELTIECLTELERLEPLGQGNAGVRLQLSGLKHHQSPQRMGREQQHAKFRVTDGNCVLEAVWWNGGESPWPEGRFDLVVTASINVYQGQRSVQLKVADWRAAV